MIEVSPPMDHVEIAVSAVDAKLESVILELRGLLQAEDIARVDAAVRAAAVHEPDKAPDAQGEKFLRIGQEYELHRMASTRLEFVVQAAEIAHDAVQLARERYRSALRQGELMKLLAVFEDADKKT
ncbi:hypothetical protein [Rhizobium leguminosarum]|uniref:hypothetical protein n=1 Tax=Rhizobium leguminosarum TaxID=384 RepID=UPI00102F5AD8|nr:hypothetical protein [Rhizobium leguminosarum]NEI66519.1 hypothetical protein [Rhizobium leguminosarum]TBF89153.1 hypothetical protein ELG82_37040 [Rhizobium leguminosarum]